MRKMECCLGALGGAGGGGLFRVAWPERERASRSIEISRLPPLQNIRDNAEAESCGCSSTHDNLPERCDAYNAGKFSR
jgi:hypothetical protein